MIYFIEPCAKPRMTQRDKWHKRKCVVDYWAFKKECQLKLISVPESGAEITFHIPMTKSWPKKKKDQMRGKPHQQKPDIDNYLKGLLDAVLDEDCKVWDVRARKLWSDEGMIVIEEIN